MRITSIILNIVLFFIVIALVVDDGWPRKVQQQFMVIVFFATPVVTLFTLWNAKVGNSESWLSLFFRRKRLEEKMKIEELKKNSGKT